MTGPYLPKGLRKNNRIRWIFTELITQETAETEKS